MDPFFVEKMKKIFTDKKSVVDIGGGIRVVKGGGNRYDESRAWLLPYVEKTDYKIMDPVPDYDPDIVGDIHALPFPDNSQDAIICMAVLEHVENPIKACEEMYRVLKPGGYLYLYVPFLFYYHPEVGYYKDYWRFTEDAVSMLMERYATKEIVKVRGAVETWIHISPLGRYSAFKILARWADRVFKKQNSKQVSGFSAFAIK